MNVENSEIKNEHIIDNEQAYPIYNIDVKWTENNDCKCGKDECLKCKRQIDGRVKNGTSFYRMDKIEEPIEKIIEFYKNEWWPDYIQKYSDKKKDSVLDVSEPIIKVEFLRYEVWCGSWFSHWTFDVGKSDWEVIRSFENFVSRMQNFNDNNRTYEKYIGKDGKEYTMDHEPYCLMGAEDRYRWKGSNKDDDGNEIKALPAPCRCKHCKKLGIIRIDH